MKNTKSSFKVLFESWKNFINDKNIINESLRKNDNLHAETFIDLFVKSDATANIAYRMILSAINDYNNIKNLSIDSEKVRQISDDTLGDPNEVIADEDTDLIIQSFNAILVTLKNRYDIKI